MIQSKIHKAKDIMTDKKKNKEEPELSVHPTHEYEMKKTIYTIIFGGAIFVIGCAAIMWMVFNQ